MLKKVIVILSIWIINIAFPHTSEIQFQVINGDGTTDITFKADAVGIVYWTDGNPDSYYAHKTATIPSDGINYAGFDWLDLNTGNTSTGDRTLGYGLYKISTTNSSNHFYWDTRDCHGSAHPDDVEWGSPDLDIVYDANNNLFISYDYGSNGANGNILEGITVPVWWMRTVNMDPDYHPYYCWEETLLELENQYNYEQIGGIITIDNISYQSGEYDYFTRNTTLEFEADSNVELANTNNVYHRNWNIQDETLLHTVDYYTDVADEIIATFKDRYTAIFTSELQDYAIIAIQDPWYVAADGSQPNTFQELNPGSQSGLPLMFKTTLSCPPAAKSL